MNCGEVSASESESMRIDERDRSSFILLWRSSEERRSKFEASILGGEERDGGS